MYADSSRLKLELEETTATCGTWYTFMVILHDFVPSVLAKMSGSLCSVSVTCLAVWTLRCLLQQRSLCAVDATSGSRACGAAVFASA